MFFLNENFFYINEENLILGNSEIRKRYRFIAENFDIISEASNSFKTLYLTEEEENKAITEGKKYIKDAGEYKRYVDGLKSTDERYAELKKNKIWTYVLLGIYALGLIGMVAGTAAGSIIIPIVSLIVSLIAIIVLTIKGIRDKNKASAFKTKLATTKSKLISLQEKVKDERAQEKIEEAINKIDAVEDYYGW